MISKIGFFLVVGILLAGCASQVSQEQKVEQQMQQPVNCATAEGDIWVLQSEKANVESQIAQGVTSISYQSLGNGHRVNHRDRGDENSGRVRRIQPDDRPADRPDQADLRDTVAAVCSPCL